MTLRPSKSASDATSHPVMNTRSLKITLLAGGPSRERSVSLSTGAAVEGALRRLGHEVRVIDPDEHVSRHLIEHRPDLVFNALHGTGGEDGMIQGILEWLKIPYTGSKLTASALAMDKELSLSVCARAHLSVPTGFTWDITEPLPTSDEVALLTAHAQAWIVKPINEGSSVGLHHCQSYAELRETLNAKIQEAQIENQAPQSSNITRWLIEEYISGVEVSVVLFEGEIWGSVEVAPHTGLYDYAAKYERKDTQYFCPPRLSTDVITRIEHQGLLAYRALKCTGVCRADFIHRSESTPQRSDILLEINTLPGMTETSLVPKVAASRGVEFDELVQKMIEVELIREGSFRGVMV